MVECGKCGKTFVDEKVLLEHIKLVHSDSPKNTKKLRAANDVALSQIQSKDPRNKKNRKHYHVCALEIPPTGLKLPKTIN